VEDLVDVRGWKAMGYKLSIDKYKEIRWLESLAVLVEDELVIDIPDLHHETEEGDSEAKEDSEIQESENSESETNTEETEPEIMKNDEAPDDSKPKKEPKKGTDPKSQLGLFE
jgi:topoisomerase-4 subunit A